MMLKRKPKSKSTRINLFSCWALNGRIIHSGTGVSELQEQGVIRSLAFSDRFISQVWSKEVFKDLLHSDQKKEWSGRVDFRFKGVDYHYDVMMVRIEDQIAATAIDIKEDFIAKKEKEQLELKVKDLTDLFSDFINHTDAHVVVIDKDFRIVSCNRSFLNLTGARELNDKLLFSIPMEFFTSEKTTAAIRKVVRTGIEKVFRFQLNKAVKGYKNVFLRVFRADHVTVILITFGFPLGMMNNANRQVPGLSKNNGSGSSIPGSIQMLSSQEVKVLGLVAKGLTSSEIGETLGISPRTADTHRGNIMKKLGINHVQGLTLLALQNGLI